MNDNTYIPQDSYGFSQPYTSYQPRVVRFNRAPTTTDKRYPYSQMWIDTTNNDIYILTNVVANMAFWQLISSGSGDVVISEPGAQLQIEGGAATDSIGTATLVAGTVTVANTNITAGDRIFIQRVAANASTTLGELSYTISAGASFTITSLILGTPASTQTGDLSTVTYLIVRQL